MKTETYYFDFAPQRESDNTETINQLINDTFGNQGSIERVEELFNITFAAGVDNGKPVFLNATGDNDPLLLKKFDGKVDLGIVPRDNETGLQFAKAKLTFKVEVKSVDDEAIFVKGIINSKTRNVLEF